MLMSALPLSDDCRACLSRMRGFHSTNRRVNFSVTSLLCFIKQCFKINTAELLLSYLFSIFDNAQLNSDFGPQFSVFHGQCSTCCVLLNWKLNWFCNFRCCFFVKKSLLWKSYAWFNFMRVDIGIVNYNFELVEDTMTFVILSFSLCVLFIEFIFYIDGYSSTHNFRNKLSNI